MREDSKVKTRLGEVLNSILCPVVGCWPLHGGHSEYYLEVRFSDLLEFDRFNAKPLRQSPTAKVQSDQRHQDEQRTDGKTRPEVHWSISGVGASSGGGSSISIGNLVV